jgi:hyperosmotically inducible protein
MRVVANVFCAVLLTLAGFGQAGNASAQAGTQTGQVQARQGQNGNLALPQNSAKLGGSMSDQRIAREVLHEMLMLPYYSLFDDISFRVENGTVVLMGEVVNPENKVDAEAAVRHVEGVQNVVNQIEILPPDPMDYRIRRAEYHAVFSFSDLYRYAMGAVPSIHIIVKNGHVTLMGVVDSQADKEMAGIQANSVPGVFSVDNQLQVEGGNNSKK